MALEATTGFERTLNDCLEENDGQTGGSEIMIGGFGSFAEGQICHLVASGSGLERTGRSAATFSPGSWRRLGDGDFEASQFGISEEFIRVLDVAIRLISTVSSMDSRLCFASVDVSLTVGFVSSGGKSLSAGASVAGMKEVRGRNFCDLDNSFNLFLSTQTTDDDWAAANLAISGQQFKTIRVDPEVLSSGFSRFSLPSGLNTSPEKIPDFVSAMNPF